ncbi:hypothetical protein JCM11251_003406 [Rhodosporidiobolus azoricus]
MADPEILAMILARNACIDPRPVTWVDYLGLTSPTPEFLCSAGLWTSDSSRLEPALFPQPDALLHGNRTPLVCDPAHFGRIRRLRDGDRLVNGLKDYFYSGLLPQRGGSPPPRTIIEPKSIGATERDSARYLDRFLLQPSCAFLERLYRVPFHIGDQVPPASVGTTNLCLGLVSNPLACVRVEVATPEACPPLVLEEMRRSALLRYDFNMAHKYSSPQSQPASSSSSANATVAGHQPWSNFGLAPQGTSPPEYACLTPTRAQANCFLQQLSIQAAIAQDLVGERNKCCGTAGGKENTGLQFFILATPQGGMAFIRHQDIFFSSRVEDVGRLTQTLVVLAATAADGSGGVSLRRRLQELLVEEGYQPDGSEHFNALAESLRRLDINESPTTQQETSDPADLPAGSTSLSDMSHAVLQCSNLSLSSQAPLDPPLSNLLPSSGEADTALPQFTSAHSHLSAESSSMTATPRPSSACLAPVPTTSTTSESSSFPPPSFPPVDNPSSSFEPESKAGNHSAEESASETEAVTTADTSLEEDKRAGSPDSGDQAKLARNVTVDDVWRAGRLFVMQQETERVYDRTLQDSSAYCVDYDEEDEYSGLPVSIDIDLSLPTTSAHAGDSIDFPAPFPTTTALEGAFTDATGALVVLRIARYDADEEAYWLARDELLTEADALYRLDGTGVAPRVGGVFDELDEGLTEMYCEGRASSAILVYEKIAGEAIASWADLAKAQEDAISALRVVHECGVLLGTPSPSHFVKTASGLRLSNFRGACADDGSATYDEEMREFVTRLSKAQAVEQLSLPI